MTNDSALSQQSELIQRLKRPSAYPHPLESVEIIETHISWLILAGDYVYKIKKPVDFGFLDYSTLSRRHHFCKEELRLNRRTAPTLYLEVVAVDQDGRFTEHTDNAVEWAVKMRRFKQGMLFDRLLDTHSLTETAIRTFARRIAEFHQNIDVRSSADSPYGHPEQIAAPMRENVVQIRDFLGENCPTPQLEAIANWTEEELKRLQTRLETRRDNGHIRECHGDLHLGNVVLIDDVPTAFDGIEFNDNLNHIDTISEIAFLTMDLKHRRQQPLAHAFVDEYLQHSGDYTGICLLQLYEVYRAMVRAKVTAIRYQQTGAQTALKEAVAYLDLAETLSRRQRPFLAITGGLSGSGKSTVAARLAQETGAIRLRSDVERKRLFGFQPDQSSDSGVASGIYTQEASQRTYETLAMLAESILAAGGPPVIVDATFLNGATRRPFSALADSHAVPFIELITDAPPDVLRERILSRSRRGNDASEADLAVLERQLEQWQLPDDEKEGCFVIDTSQAWDLKAVIRYLDMNRVGGD